MVSAEHQHGASAAPPPKAAPLPSESASTPKNPACCNATPKANDVSAAATVVSKPPPTASSVPSSTTPSSITATSSSSSFATGKKRPLAIATSTANLVVPALKSALKKSTVADKNEPQKTVAPVKAKKTIKKKKKKFSSILSGMMKPKKTKVDVQAEREKLRNSLGGGNFAKVAKI